MSSLSRVPPQRRRPVKAASSRLAANTPASSNPAVARTPATGSQALPSKSQPAPPPLNQIHYIQNTPTTYHAPPQPAQSTPTPAMRPTTLAGPSNLPHGSTPLHQLSLIQMTDPILSALLKGEQNMLVRLDGVKAAAMASQDNIATRLDAIQAQIRDQGKQITDAMKLVNQLGHFSVKNFGEMASGMKQLEKRIGRSEDRDERSIMSRLDAITYMAGDLWERAKDPEADDPDDAIQTNGIIYREMATSPCRHDYSNASILTERPPSGLEAPSPRRSMASVQVATSPWSSPKAMESASMSSTTDTLADEDDAEFGPQLRNLLRTPFNSSIERHSPNRDEDVAMELAYPAGVTDDAMDIQTEELPPFVLQSQECRKTRTPCKANSFSRVDWTKENMDLGSPGNAPQDEQPIAYFRPDLSPAVLKKSASYTSHPPVEGSVAELRLEALGDASFIGPEEITTSTPRMIPLVAPPEVSPLPSPSTSRSASPEPLHASATSPHDSVDDHQTDLTNMDVEEPENTDVQNIDEDMLYDDEATILPSEAKTGDSISVFDLRESEGDDQCKANNQDYEGVSLLGAEEGAEIGGVEGEIVDRQDKAATPEEDKEDMEDTEVPSTALDVSVEDELLDDSTVNRTLVQPAQDDADISPLEKAPAKEERLFLECESDLDSNLLPKQGVSESVAVAQQDTENAELPPTLDSDFDIELQSDIDQDELAQAIWLSMQPPSSPIKGTPAASPTTAKKVQLPKHSNRTSAPSSPITFKLLKQDMRQGTGSSSTDEQQISTLLLPASSPAKGFDGQAGEQRLPSLPPSSPIERLQESEPDNVQTPRQGPITVTTVDSAGQGSNLAPSLLSKPFPTSPRKSQQPLSSPVSWKPIGFVASPSRSKSGAEVACSTPVKAKRASQRPGSAALAPPASPSPLKVSTSFLEQPVHSTPHKSTPTASEKLSIQIDSISKPAQTSTIEVISPKPISPSRLHAFLLRSSGHSRSPSAGSPSRNETEIVDQAQPGQELSEAMPVDEEAPPDSSMMEPDSLFDDVGIEYEDEEEPFVLPPVADEPDAVDGQPDRRHSVFSPAFPSALTSLRSSPASEEPEPELANRIATPARAKTSVRPRHITPEPSRKVSPTKKRSGSTRSVEQNPSKMRAKQRFPDVIVLNSSPEKSPRVGLQAKIKKREKKRLLKKSGAKSSAVIDLTVDDSSSDSVDYDVDTDDSTEIVSTIKTRKNSGEGGAPKPLLKLKDNLRSGQSAAATRVKKRKQKEEDTDERPLKRAREFVPTIRASKVKKEKASNSKYKPGEEILVTKRERVEKSLARSSTSNGASGSSLHREDAAQPPSAADSPSRQLRAREKGKESVKWPAPNQHGTAKFKRKFVKCDLCNAWYHYGCVGIEIEDLRLRDSEIFACPPCHSNAPLKFLTEAEKAKGKCGRPNCAQRERESDEYFVAGIIGRKPAANGRGFRWLVKWDGYPLFQSTWQNESDMPEPGKLIEEFNATAEREGYRTKNPLSVILLKEVRAKTWPNPDYLHSPKT